MPLSVQFSHNKLYTALENLCACVCVGDWFSVFFSLGVCVCVSCVCYYGP